MPRASTKTVLGVAQSRELIENTMRKWGVSGISWSDDFEENAVILRFRWKDGDHNYVARFILQLPSDDDLREAALDGRSGRFSSKKFERLCADRGKREHYMLAMFVKTNFEAVEEGIVTAQQVFIPWLEDADGITIAERLSPKLYQLTETTLPKMLKASE